jgi:hypothetical protein
MAGNFKAQATYEFIAVAVMLFTIIIYSLNSLMTNFNEYRSDFMEADLQSRIIQISEVLVRSNETGIASPDGWPVLSYNSIKLFNQTCVDDYGGTLMRYEMNYNNMNINITGADGMVLMNCGRRVPESTGTAHIERVGVLDTDSTLVTLSIYAW